MQCRPQFAQLEAGMQQLDKRFLREKQKLDHLGRDCCIIPTLCELFPKLNTGAIQERCGMIDKYQAYQQEMQVIFAPLQFGQFIHYLLLSFVHLSAVTGAVHGILRLNVWAICMHRYVSRHLTSTMYVMQLSCIHAK